MNLLCIDPGLASGWALFSDGVLVGCGLLHVSPEDSTAYKDLSDYLGDIDACIVERPKIYPGRRQRANPASIITLALMAGAAMAYCGSRTTRKLFVEPREWKGTRPKDVDNRRTVSLLTSDESKVLDLLAVPKSQLNNVLDAIGIGLWALERKRT